MAREDEEFLGVVFRQDPSALWVSIQFNWKPYEMHVDEKGVLRRIVALSHALWIWYEVVS